MFSQFKYHKSLKLLQEKSAAITFAKCFDNKMELRPYPHPKSRARDPSGKFSPDISLAKKFDGSLDIGFLCRLYFSIIEFTPQRNKLQNNLDADL